MQIGKIFFIFLVLTSSSAAFAAGFNSASLASASVTNTGAYLNAGYSACPNLAAKVDIWILSGSTYEFHNRCYINSKADPAFPDQSYCGFKYTLTPGQSANNILVRIWRVASDCQTYADEAGATTQYDDFPMSGTVPAESSYQAQSRLVTVDKGTYRAKIDQNGGTTYEFYNKRGADSGLVAGHYENALHPNMGAALQIAIHSGALNSLTSSPCGGQGYWNPNQSGAACGYASGAISGITSSSASNSGLQLSCDGVVNNQCSSAVSSVDFGLFRMMNWDYGPGYSGPFNPLDTAYMSENVDAEDNFLAYTVSVVNQGVTRTGIIEAPTFYFNNHYATYFYPTDGVGVSPGTVAAASIPRDTAGVDQLSAFQTISQDNDWISFTNTSLGVSGNSITVAAFFDLNFSGAMQSDSSSVSTTQYYHQIKYGQNPLVQFATGQSYGLKYVLFPYRYDEVIPSPYGNVSVANVIRGMKADFKNPVTGTIDGVSGPNVTGWACALGSANSIQIQLFAGGPVGVGTSLGVYTANVASEPAVASACRSNGTAYRFSIPLSGFLAQFGGESIFIHGLSPFGGTSYLLSSSGKFSVPMPSPTSSPLTSPTVPVYRFYSSSTGEHFFTATYNEGVAAGFSYEGVGFHVLEKPIAGAVPVFRCYAGSKHFVSTSWNCEGTKLEGQYGYLYLNAVPGTTALYRFFSPSSGDHLETTLYSEGVNAGLHLDGTLGYVPN